MKNPRTKEAWRISSDGQATEEGRRTGIPASTLWVSAAGKRPRQEPLKPRTNVSCRFLENQLAISFKFFDILCR
jgi:hypothetical protein